MTLNDLDEYDLTSTKTHYRNAGRSGAEPGNPRPRQGPLRTVAGHSGSCSPPACQCFGAQCLLLAPTVRILKKKKTHQLDAKDSVIPHVLKIKIIKKK